MNWEHILVAFIIVFAVIVLAVGWEMNTKKNNKDIADEVVKKLKESEKEK